MKEKRVIIITGGSSGIGKESALILASEGVKLVIADMDFEGATKVVNSINSQNGDAKPFLVDVSKEEQVQALIDFTVKEYGTITGIFNNAGIGLVKPLLEMNESDYRKVIEVDQFSVYFGMRIAAKKMIELGIKNGVIINNASIYGYSAAIGCFNYNAAKSAVVAMTRTGALELAPNNIRVVGVAPGFVDTPILKGLDDATKEYLAGLHMRKKLIQPKKIGEVVAFLFSEKSDAINGTTVVVDDGYLAYK